MSSPKYLKRGIFFSNAAAFATANETERIALAPNFDLLGVLSSSIIFESINSWSKTDKFSNFFEINLFTFLTASYTDLPIKSWVLSLNSIASCSPVDAPEGTAALPRTPL